MSTLAREVHAWRRATQFAPVTPSERERTGMGGRNIAMRMAQWDKFTRLGGTRWLRAAILAAPEVLPTRAERLARRRKLQADCAADNVVLVRSTIRLSDDEWAKTMRCGSADFLRQLVDDAPEPDVPTAPKPRRRSGDARAIRRSS